MRPTKSGPEEFNSSASSQQSEKSQENFGISALTRCLVDAEGNTTAGAGRSRRKALGVSALVQFCTLTALLIVPLFATGSRFIVHQTNFVPLPPYGGAPRHDLPHTQAQATSTNHLPLLTVFHDQIQMPTRPQTKFNSLEDADLRLGPTTSSNSDAVPGGEGTGGATNLIPGIPGPSGPPPPLPEPKLPPSPRKPIAVSQGVQLALLIHRVEPVYPNFAKQTHREGTVELRAIISTDGAVKDLRVLSGDPVLAQAARDAVAQWRFRPTLLNGVAVEVITFITVNFHIGQ
jgi:protein TonB